MPPAVFSSASRRFTTILSFNGTTFMPSSLLLNWYQGVTLARRFGVGRSVDADQRANHRIEYDVFVNWLGNHAVSPLLESLAHQVLGDVGRDEDARQKRPHLPQKPDRVQPRERRHVHIEQCEVDRLGLGDFQGLLAARRLEGAITLRLPRLPPRLPAE